MYTHILIAVDGSEVATKALNHGLSLARELGSTVTIVTVTERWDAFELANDARQHPGRNPVEDFERTVGAAAAKILQAAAAAAEKVGVSAETVHIRNAHPASGIIKTAEENGCSIIVMGSHGRKGLGRLMLGSQAAEVLASSKIPVLIVR